ncbi:unnamed protein product [Lampetra planeri]
MDAIDARLARARGSPLALRAPTRRVSPREHNASPWHPRLAESVRGGCERAPELRVCRACLLDTSARRRSDLGTRLRKGPDPEGDGAMKSARVEEETMADDDYDLAELTCHGFYFGFVARITEGRAL